MNDKRTRGAYAPGLATRDAIIMAAIRLISTYGYRGFSLRDLAKEVGISHPAVIYHYPSKDALITAVMAYYEDALGIFATKTDDHTGQLKFDGLKVDTLFGTLVQLMRLSAHPHAALLCDLECVFIVEAAAPEHPAHRYAVERSHALLEFLTERIESINEEMNLGLDFNSAALAQSIVRTWVGLGIHRRYVPGGAHPMAMVAELIAVVAHNLRLNAELILDLGALVPPECEEVYTRAVRRYRELRG